jgi:alkanesulfonate monooxygenase SsuD/methylene tetrahydromethanopterin reductase-like flavin-dependent oxidoreductase (luciferase family)
VNRLPAVSFVATPGRSRHAGEVAVDIERRGFAGLYCPSVGTDQLSFCVSVAHATTTLVFGTSIQPIYFRRPWDLATTAQYLHEVSDGRFRLGLGVSHGVVTEGLELDTGRPLADMRAFVKGLRAAAASSTDLPPVLLATLRDRMVDLSVEIAEGAVWANAARSHMEAQLARIPESRRAAGFTVANMIPTVIDDDRGAAAALIRRTLTDYLYLPNYRRYWAAAGYQEEMAEVAEALADGRHDRLRALMTDRWLHDVSLFGSVAEVREGVEAWQEVGVSTPILVPSSTSGGQREALSELFDAFV